MLCSVHGNLGIIVAHTSTQKIARRRREQKDFVVGVDLLFDTHGNLFVFLKWFLVFSYFTSKGGGVGCVQEYRKYRI